MHEFVVNSGRAASFQNHDLTALVALLLLSRLILPHSFARARDLHTSGHRYVVERSRPDLWGSWRQLPEALQPYLPYSVDNNAKLYDDLQSRLLVDVTLLALFAVPHSICAPFNRHSRHQSPL
jgi:hypothetical protein